MRVLDQQNLVDIPTRFFTTLTLNLPKHVRKGGAQGYVHRAYRCFLIAVPRVVKARGNVGVQILDKQEYQPSKTDGGPPAVDE